MQLVHSFTPGLHDASYYHNLDFLEICVPFGAPTKAQGRLRALKSQKVREQGAYTGYEQPHAHLH